jgi:hypothetical protein
LIGCLVHLIARCDVGCLLHLFVPSLQSFLLFILLLCVWVGKIIRSSYKCRPEKKYS